MPYLTNNEGTSRRYPFRRVNLLRNFNKVPNKSPAYLVMDSMRFYQEILKIDLTISTNKAILKKQNSEDRTRRADTMQSRSRSPSLLSQRIIRDHF